MKNVVLNENTGSSNGQMKNQSTKSLALSGILIAIGFVLHSVVPPLFFGIKPDFLLACMFVSVIAGANVKNTITTGIVAGIVAALTTGFPGGQIPSVLDKLISAFAVYLMLKAIPSNISNNKKVLIFAFISFVGTVVSGLVFLGSAYIIAGLPAEFVSLVIGIVIPTAFANLFFGALMYKLYLAFAKK